MTATTTSGVRWSLAWLIHPVSAVALLVMVLNDHVLKAQFGTWWTGKLSDVAGLIFFPALVALVLAGAARLPRYEFSPARLAAVAIAVTAVGFTWVKTADAGAATASAVLSAVAGPSVVLRDPTDLLALPALALAWWVARHTAPHLRTAARRTAAIVILPAAALASVATSPAPEPEYYENFTPREYTDVVAVDDYVYADYGRGNAKPDGWAKHMVGWDADAWGAVRMHWAGGTGYDDGKAVAELSPQDELPFSCVEPERTTCYRADDTGIGVDMSLDGGETWNPEWRLDPADEAALEECWLEYWHVDDAPGKFETRAVAVLQVPGGYEVWAANGLDGLSYLSVDGEWIRVGDPLHERADKGAVPLLSEDGDQG